MKDKSQRAGGGLVLTETEIRRLSSMKPGETATVAGVALTCKLSKPYLSGVNCQLCALHHIGCRGVACMGGVAYTDADGSVARRKEDVCYVAYLGHSPKKLGGHGGIKG